MPRAQTLTLDDEYADHVLRLLTTWHHRMDALGYPPRALPMLLKDKGNACTP